MRQKQLWAEHASYAAHNPDLRALLSDFIQHLLIDKPADVLDFCAQYFDAFAAAYSADQQARAWGSDVGGVRPDDGSAASVGPEVGDGSAHSGVGQQSGSARDSTEGSEAGRMKQSDMSVAE